MGRRGAPLHVSDADISVHAAYRMMNSADGSIETSESGMANAQIGAFLNEIGLSADAIRYFTFASPSEDLLDITPEIAQALSIDVYIQKPNSVVSPSERPTPRRITRQVSEYSALAGNCTELFSVKGTIWKEQARVVLNHGHQIFGDEIFAPLLGEYVAVIKADIEQQGIVRWCLQQSRTCAEMGCKLEFQVLATNARNHPHAPSSQSAARLTCGHWIERWPACTFYYRENADASRSQEFLSSQRAWLSRRDQCADDISCLYERYSSRLFDFGT